MCVPSKFCILAEMLSDLDGRVVSKSTGRAFQSGSVREVRFSQVFQFIAESSHKPSCQENVRGWNQKLHRRGVR